MSVAVVTGAARGIGAATVRALADRGWSVVAVDRAADDPTLPYQLGTRAELDALKGPTVVPVVADVRDHVELESAVTQAEERFGGVDAAFAVAGVVAGGVAQWELPAEQERTVIDVNLIGSLNLARATIPAMLRRAEPRSGRFVAVTSTAATRGLPMLAAYCAAKAGTTGLVRALARELAGTGITALAVAPGSTATRILDESARLYGLADAGEFAGQQPIGRLVDPAEVAEVLAFLAGPAGAAMTGSEIAVDGGLAL